MTLLTDWTPLDPTGSRSRSEPVGSVNGDWFPTGSRSRVTPPGGGVPSGNQSPATEHQWGPPTPELAPRLWPAWQAMLAELRDGDWHLRATTVAAMTANSDIQSKTAANLIACAAKHGLVVRRKHLKIRQDRLTVFGLEVASATPPSSSPTLPPRNFPSDHQEPPR